MLDLKLFYVLLQPFKTNHISAFLFLSNRFMIIIKTRRLVCVIKWWRIIQFQAKLLMVSLPSRHVVLFSVLGLVTWSFIPLMSSFITSHLDIIKLGRHLGHSEYKSCHSWIYELAKIGNSMICSDISHKYHEWYFKILIRILSDIYAKYHVQIMLLFVCNTTRKGFVIFTCRYFKLSWNTTALSQSN